MLIKFIITTILVALFASWVISFCHKFEVRHATLHEWALLYAPHALIQKALECHFCLSWWTCVCISIIVSIIFGCWWYLLCPFFATKITQFFTFGD